MLEEGIKSLQKGIQLNRENVELFEECEFSSRQLTLYMCLNLTV